MWKSTTKVSRKKIMSLSFENQTVIVTGAAGGLGLAIAKAFAAQGANVVITDIDDKRLSECPAAFEEAEKSRVLALKVNGTDEEAVQGLIKTAVEKFGRLDVLVNNAGVNDHFEPVGDCSRAMWDKNLLVNVTAPFISSQLAVRQFLEQEPKKGVILNVISAAGVNGFRAG
jgi:NAD(P)-dependent dehydrogenase (short-subunit alcohol dehydrogenase family)